jgi:serine/threonine protein kinase
MDLFTTSLMAVR